MAKKPKPGKPVVVDAGENVSGKKKQGNMNPDTSAEKAKRIAGAILHKSKKGK